ncbi:MAG TPA: hypothetical protein VGS59_08930 [Candidatus Acidoferrales bacterium]|nr:hypothetical protein [Candidatus Acidoferrales bacterium]
MDTVKNARYNITDEDAKRSALSAAEKYRDEQKKHVAAMGQK